MKGTTVFSYDSASIYDAQIDPSDPSTYDAKAAEAAASFDEDDYPRG